MRILVTGHTGYIGSVLTPVLQAEGHQVVGLDHQLFDHASVETDTDSRARSTVGALPIPLLNGSPLDVRDIGPRDLAGFDAVIHLASLQGGPGDEWSPALTLELNHLASVRLGALAKFAGVRRFLFASTCAGTGGGSFGLAPHPRATVPLSAFDLSKLRTEKDLEQLTSASFQACALRIPSAYGMSPRLRLDLVVNRMVARAVFVGGDLDEAFEHGLHRPVHVMDVADAFRLALEAPEEVLGERVFDLGAGVDPISTRALLRQVTGACPPIALGGGTGGAQGADHARASCPASLAAGLPGFGPTRVFADEIRQLADEFIRLGLTRDVLEDASFRRDVSFTRMIAEGHFDASLRIPLRAAR